MILNYIILGITGLSYIYSLLATTQHKDTEQEENQFSSIAEALKNNAIKFFVHICIVLYDWIETNELHIYIKTINEITKNTVE